MGFVKRFERDVFYQGQSYTRSIYKKGGGIWESNEGGVFEMFGEDGTTVVSGTMTKSVDNLYLIVHIQDDQTEALNGKYIINADFTDSTDDTVKIPLVEFSLQYKEKKAT